LFDRIIAVDWSARSTPSPATPTKDAIYICNQGPGDWAHPTYHRTRAAAMQMIHLALDQAVTLNERVFLGFDFGFGYPAGFAARLTGKPEALAVWDWLEERIQDAPDNANNRFDVAAEMNGLFGGIGPFWGCPHRRNIAGLPAKGTDRHSHGLPDRRAVEQVVKSAQSSFKLFTTGSVGSQSLLGLPYLARLRRRYGDALTVWPQQSGWGIPHAQIVLAEIYPSIYKLGRLIPLAARYPSELYHIPDAVQVRDACDAMLFGSEMPDRAFATPLGLVSPDRIAREEGWIFGAGFAKTKT
jgi:molybdopterin molybdotransferase